MTTLFWSAFETGQFFFAPSAACSKAAWSIPSTLPRTSNTLFVILGAPSTISSVTAARVSMRVAGCPAFSSADESAMLKQPACAAAIISSGLVPFFPSKRVPKLKAALKTPLWPLKLPFPSLSVPSHVATALLVGTACSLDEGMGNLARRTLLRYALSPPLELTHGDQERAQEVPSQSGRAPPTRNAQA